MPGVCPSLPRSSFRETSVRNGWVGSGSAARTFYYTGLLLGLTEINDMDGCGMRDPWQSRFALDPGSVKLRHSRWLFVNRPIV